MAQIPTYEREEKLSTEIPAVEINPKFAGSTGRILEASGEVLEKFANKLQELQDLRQRREAEVNLINWGNDLYQRAINDPDIDNVPNKITQEINKKKSELLSKITSPEEQLNFERDFTSFVSTLQTKIQSHLWQQQAFKKEIADEEYFKAQIQRYPNATEEEKAMIKNDILNRLKEDVFRGFRTDENALSKYRQILEDFKVNDFFARTEKYGAERMLEELDKKDSELLLGLDLTPEDRQKFKEQLNRIINREKKIEQVEKEGSIKLFEIANNIFNDATPDEINQHIKEALDKGEITEKQAQVLTLFNQQISNESIEKQASKKLWLRELFKFLIPFPEEERKKALKEQVNKLKTDLLARYLSRITTGEDPRAVVMDLINTKLKDDISSFTPQPSNKEYEVSATGLAFWEKEGKKEEKPVFYSLEEAQKANLPKGTEFILYDKEKNKKFIYKVK